ncbi:hypothetical protein C2G38_957895 [Gigaspora rosea]|uniref:Secreted protein n=1 Tax=Gigaspora rosea TaxID=44941 RepID=A0A397VJR8_9GLOM|nr:hypothetical protein C2G38_957895 [Gigaspora rosea]
MRHRFKCIYTLELLLVACVGSSLSSSSSSHNIHGDIEIVPVKNFNSGLPARTKNLYWVTNWVTRINWVTRVTRVT